MREHYADCHRCLTGERDPSEQRRWRCTVVKCDWGPPGEEPAPYLGGEGVHGEDDTDGCPGGWYRTAFYQSFAKYRRGKHDSLYLRDCRDPLVYEAVAYYEAEMARRSDY